MNIWNRVFMGLVIVTAIAVLVLAGLEGSIRSKGQQHIAKLEQQIEETNKKIADVISGTDVIKPSVEKSLPDLGIDEYIGLNIERFSERGRAWFGCLVRSVEEINLQQGLPQVEAQVIVTGPFTVDATGAETDVVIPDILKGVVYVFEVFETPDDSGTLRIEAPGKFLGRFNVNTVPTPTKFQGADENQKNGFAVTLISADPIDGQEIVQIKEAQARQSHWALYMTPPVNRIMGIIDQLTDEQKIRMMTPLRTDELAEEEKQKLLEEFTQKYQPPPVPELTDAEKEGVDAQALAMWEQYQQAMSGSEYDFAVSLDWLYQRKSRFKRDIALFQRDLETYKTAEEKNTKENAELEKDCVLEEKRAAAMNVQRDRVKDMLEQYIAEGKKMAVEIEKLQALQAAYAAKMTEYQLKVVEKIEARQDEPQ